MSIQIDLTPGSHPDLTIHSDGVIVEVLHLANARTLTLDVMDRGRRECRIFIGGDDARKLRGSLTTAIAEQDAFNQTDADLEEGTAKAIAAGRQ